MVKLSQNTAWLYISLAIYLILIILLVIVIIFNFLYINGPPKANCPNPNKCPPCDINVCEELNVNSCSGSNQTLTSLKNPNPAFEFNLLGSVAQDPALGIEGSIGNFQQAFSTTILKTVNNQNYYSMKNLSDTTIARFRFSERLNTLIEQTQEFTFLRRTTAIETGFYPLVLSIQNFDTTTTVTGVINYESGTIKFTDSTANNFWLYLADSNEVPDLNLNAGEFVPVWTSTSPVNISDPKYNKYIWTLYQVIS